MSTSKAFVTLLVSPSWAKSISFILQDKLNNLDVLEQDNAESNIELKKSFELQSQLNKNVEQLLAKQVVQNEAQTDIILTLQATINNLKESLQAIQEIQKDSSNVTASCKAIVHSFSLADPFDWYYKHSD